MKLSKSICVQALLCLGALVLGGREIYLRSDVDIAWETPSGQISSIKMSRREAKLLCGFFQEVLIRDPLAYTLAGEKPMSFASYHPIGFSITSLAPPNIRIIRGWRIWQKYEHHFRNERLLFWEDKNPWGGSNPFLILADREQCHKIIDQHTTEFQHLPTDLFQNIGTVPFLRDTLQNNELLAGILLGFGKTNAALYCEKIAHPELPKIPGIWRSERDYESERYCWKYLTLQKLDMSDLLLPKFVGDPDSEESKQLKEKYLATREKIQRFYRDRDFLEATLSLYKYGTKILDTIP